MLSIYSLISPKCIYINPDVKNKEELFELMVKGISTELGITDPKQLFEAVMSREELSNTSLGCGCAVPHALTATVDKTAICAAVTPRGIDYDAPDGQPVTMVFMMVGPESGARIHLKLLSKIARLFHNKEFRSRLKKVESPEEFIRILKTQEE